MSVERLEWRLPTLFPFFLTTGRVLGSIPVRVLGLIFDGVLGGGRKREGKREGGRKGAFKVVKGRRGGSLASGLRHPDQNHDLEIWLGFRSFVMYNPRFSTITLYEIFRLTPTRLRLSTNTRAHPKGLTKYHRPTFAPSESPSFNEYPR